MARDNPQVTVAIPAYNSAMYIAGTIESVLAQDTRNYEFVVCDDGSSDMTQDICRRYASRGVEYVRFSEHGGQATNWNRCIGRARGDYMVILHDDDTLAPTYLRRAGEVLNSDSGIGLVHCAVTHVDDAGRPFGLQRLFDTDVVLPGEAFWRRLIVQGCLINPAGVMVRRAVYEKLGGFTSEVLWGVDWHMWLRVCLEASVAYLAEPLATYRHRAGSGTVAVTLTARNGADEQWVVEDMFRRVATRPDLIALRQPALRQVAHRTWCHAERMCQQGHMDAARAGLARAVKSWPGILLQRRVMALWIATWLGYDSFRRVKDLRNWFGRVRAREPRS